MHDARRVGAFFSGLFLYITAILFACLMAEFHLPREAYMRMGGRASVTVLAVEALLIALLIFVVSLVWSYVTVKPSRKGRRTAIAWFLSGVGTAWLGGLIYGVFYFALHPRSYQSMASLLLVSDAPPLWGLFNIVSVVSAALLAHAVARRLNPKSPNSYSRPMPKPAQTKTLPA